MLSMQAIKIFILISLLPTNANAKILGGGLGEMTRSRTLVIENRLKLFQSDSAPTYYQNIELPLQMPLQEHRASVHEWVQQSSNDLQNSYEQLMSIEQIFSNMLISQIQDRLDIAESYFVHASYDLRRIQDDLDAIQKVRDRVKPFKEQWDFESSDFSQSNQQFSARMNHLLQKSKAVSSEIKKCVVSIKNHLEEIQQVSNLTNTELTIPSQLLQEVQHGVEQAKTATSREIVVSKLIQESSEKFNLMGNQATSMTAQANQKVIQQNAKLITLNQSLDVEVAGIKKAQMRIEQASVEISKIKIQIDRLIEDKNRIHGSTRMDFERLQQINQKLSILNQEIQSPQLSASQASGEIESHKFKIHSMRSDFESKYQAQIDVYAESWQKLKQFKNDQVQMSQSLAEQESMLGEMTVATQQICKSESTVTELETQAGVRDQILFHKKTNETLESYPKNNQGILADHETPFELKTKFETTEGKAVRNILNREFLLEDAYHENPINFHPEYFDLSRDLIAGFDAGLASSRIAINDLDQAAQFIRDVQDYAAGILSFGIGFVPYVNHVKDAIEIYTGKDVITDEPLSDATRTILAFAIVIPVGGNSIARVLGEAAEVSTKTIWKNLFKEIADHPELAQDLNFAQDLLSQASRVEIEVGRFVPKAKVLKIESAETVNQFWSKLRGISAPYLKNSHAITVQLEEDMKAYRVVSDDYAIKGDWLIPFDPRIMSKEKIRDLFSIPSSNSLEYVVSVDLKKGDIIRFGVSGKIKNSIGGGSGIQIDLMGRSLDSLRYGGLEKW